MKKTILLLVITLLSGSVLLAGTRTDTTKTKPVVKSAPVPPAQTYNPDPAKLVKLDSLVFSLSQLNSFSIVENMGASLDNSSQLTGAQIQSIKTEARAVVVAINKRFTEIVKKDFDAFKADTAAKGKVFRKNKQ